MRAQDIREPTTEECDQCAKIAEDEHCIAYAIWYPQMGGYVGKAVAVFGKEEAGGSRCFDVTVWHDGQWPFHDGQPGTQLHHCDAEQFIEFGKRILELQGAAEV